MKIERYNKFINSNIDHCWQYQIRLETLQKDLNIANMTKNDIVKLKVSDFDFCYIDKSNKDECRKIKQFIEREEFLGTIPNRPTHRFVAYHKNTGILAGSIIMAVPNTFSYLLGKEYKHKEKLISRGACISWSPKNLASWLISKSINWMVRNTKFRIFTAYADPEANELGIIYQALNFFYLGQNSGITKQYFDPTKPEKGWFSDRHFRHKSNYLKYALELGIDKNKWNNYYMARYTPRWGLMSQELIEQIKQKEKEYKNNCNVRKAKLKHKYVLIKGNGKRETIYLKKIFFYLNPNQPLNYPKNRGE